MRWDAELAHWSVVGDAQDLRRSPQRREIKDVLRKAGEPMGPKKVAEALGKTDNRIRQLMHKMGKSGELVNTNGAYTLPNNDNPDD